MAAKARKIRAKGEARLDAEFVLGVVLVLVPVEEEVVLVDEVAR